MSAVLKFLSTMIGSRYTEGVLLFLAFALVLSLVGIALFSPRPPRAETLTWESLRNPVIDSSGPKSMPSPIIDLARLGGK